VITCRDSGGPAELVDDGVNGVICDPTPQSVAAGLRRIMGEPDAARRMGAAALASSATLTWRNVVAELTA